MYILRPVRFPLPAALILSLALAACGKGVAHDAPEVKAKLEDFGLEVTPSDGPALAAFIQKETTFWHALIKERKLSAEQ